MWISFELEPLVANANHQPKPPWALLLCALVSLVANAKHQPKLKLWGELLTIWAWAQHCAWVVGGLPLGLNLNVDCS